MFSQLNEQLPFLKEISFKTTKQVKTASFIDKNHQLPR